METNYNTPDQAANTVDQKDVNSKMEVQVSNKLLLIEDNPGDARLVELLLMDTEMSDFVITHETTLGDGINRLEEGNEYQAILLDLTLPDSRGFETLEKLLAKFPDNNVIVLTGLSDQTLGVNAVKA